MVSVAAVAAALAGRIAIAEVAGGASLLLVAGLLASELAGRVEYAVDPGEVLLFDLLLALAVVVGLVGVGLVGLVLR